jgi:hypothetical protein
MNSATSSVKVHSRDDVLVQRLDVVRARVTLNDVEDDVDAHPVGGIDEVNEGCAGSCSEKMNRESERSCRVLT